MLPEAIAKRLVTISEAIGSFNPQGSQLISDVEVTSRQQLTIGKGVGPRGASPAPPRGGPKCASGMTEPAPKARTLTRHRLDHLFVLLARDSGRQRLRP